jgi:drug/metabolite transporter (DMT)-like permease
VSASARSGLALALLGVVGFSLTLPVTKIALRGFDAWTVASGRMAIAGAVAAVVLLATRAPRPSREQMPAVLAVTAGVVVGFPLLSTLALQHTTAAHAAVVIAALPIATAVLAVLHTRERMGALFWASSAVGTLAVVAFALTRGGAEGAGLLPDLLLLGAVVAAAIGYSRGGRLAAEMPGWMVISWPLALAVPVTAPWFLLTLARDPLAQTVPPVPAAALLFLALVPQYTAFFAFYAGLARAGVAQASQTQLLQPLLTLGWAVLLLDERVGGGTLLAAGVVVLSVAGTQRARAPARGVGD